jgi:hypothetical protein
MDAIKGFGQSPKSTSIKKLNNKPRDVTDNHMRTKLVKLNEANN